MPARTVIIEKLTKFTGERHEFLTPGQYTQLTGRAGRRGIDAIGHAVVLWSPYVPFADVAALASSRTFVLTSSFRPTYNMAANLVRRYDAAQAHHLLNLSFAQYQADRAVVRLELRLGRREALLEDLRAEVRCDRGDVGDYVGLLDEARRRREEQRRGGRDGVERALEALRPGDVLRLRGGKNAGPVAVVSVAQRKGTVKVRAITEGRRVVNLGADDFDRAPEVTATITLPEPFAPHNPAFQRQVAQSLHRLPRHTGARRSRPTAGTDRPAAWTHPVADCPDLDQHVQAFRRLDRAEREVRDLRRQIEHHTQSLARDFDRILQLLEAWAHLDGWALTERGERLVRIYHESDLLIAECLELGVLDDLDPASLAGLVSCFTYEHRSPEPPPAPWFPSLGVRHRFEQMAQVAADLNEDEKLCRLPLTRPPDPTFFALAHAWAAGESLHHVLEDEDLSGGDFVRNAKQLIDLLRQIGDAAAAPSTRRSARQAADAVFRGVVSASSAIGPAADGEPGATTRAASGGSDHRPEPA